MKRSFSNSREDKSNNRSSLVKTKAAALKYDGVNTPKVVAKGEGSVAEEIIKIAQQNQVHIHYDPLLLEVLSRLELNEEIPETLYLAVAKIIAFAYFLQGKCPKGFDASLNADSFSQQSSPSLTQAEKYLDQPQPLPKPLSQKLKSPAKTLDNLKKINYYKADQRHQTDE